MSESDEKKIEELKDFLEKSKKHSDEQQKLIDELSFGVPNKNKVKIWKEMKHE